MKTILLVDDDAHILNAMGRYLQDLGYGTLKAQFATDALHLLDTVSPVDLVVTDYYMPGGMNGCELAKAIRDFGYKMPIWLYSASVIDAEMAKDSGIDKVFLKFCPREFWSAIKNFGK